MLRSFLGLLIVPLFCSISIAQAFESSNLPIVIIDTEGRSIRDEPKITARMKIVDNSEGGRNFVESETYQYDGFIGIELRGQSSLQLFPKKSFGIETRDSLGEDRNVPLLGMPEENDWVIHSPYSDKTLFRNALIYSLASRAMAYAPRVRMCELVLNDEYYGVVLFTEKIKRDKNRVDISKLTPEENSGDDLTGGYILRFDKAIPQEIAWTSPYTPFTDNFQKVDFIHHYPKWDVITVQQLNYIQTHITEFEDVMDSKEFKDPINGYSKYIDVLSFIDQMLVNELARNVDGYRLSTYMYKEKDSKGGKLHMGPLWDFNLGFGNANYCRGGDFWGWAWNFNQVCASDTWVNHFWWNRLLSDFAYKKQLKERWISLRDDQWSDAEIFGLVDSFEDLLDESQQRNFERWDILNQWIWPNNFVGDSYTSEVNYLREWLHDRLEWMDKEIANFTRDQEPEIDELVSLLIKPNPVRGIAILEFTDIEGEQWNFDIFDQMGRKVFFDSTAADYSLDVSEYPAGIYRLRAYTVNQGLELTQNFVVIN